MRAHRIARSGDDFLVRLSVDDMLERLSLVARPFERACALFAGTPYLAERLEASPQVERVDRLEEGVGESGATPDAPGLRPATYDLVCAPLALHGAVDLPGALIQVARALKPDGLLLASLPGPRTLQELRAVLLEAEAEVTGGAAQRVDLFAEVRDAGALLQRAGLALPVADTDVHVVRYGAFGNLVADLRRMGATYPDPHPGNRATFARAAALYAERFADPDGRLRATFEHVSLSGWSPHASQQKPLRPGSAKARLAEALGTVETKA